MNRITIPIFTWLMFFSLAFIGYSNSIDQSNLSVEGSDKINQFPSDSVKIMSPNSNIKFYCTLGDTTKFGDNFMIDIKCVVKNNSKDDVNYLSQSCNGLDYYIVLKPDSYKIMPFINCNGTWAMIKELKSGDSIEIKTQIFKYKDAETIEKIGLDFRIVNQFISFETLLDYPELIEEIYLAETIEKNIIWN